MILNNYHLGSGSGSSHSGSGGARITDKKNIVSKSGENTPPPPLPSTAPPIHRAPLRGRKVGEDDDLYDDAPPFEYDSDDGNLYEESENTAVRKEIPVQNNDQIYENSEVSFEVSDQIYENADILSGNNNEKVPVAIGNANSSVSLDENEKKNKNLTQFGYKLPGLKSLKNTNEKVLAPEGALKINNTTKSSVSLQQRQRSPIPSPRSVKQTVLVLEGATTGETDDGTMEDDDGFLYEDAETVFPVT